MRHVVLDTETTGLEPERDHRIIEIGCIEIVNRRITGRTYHQYLCPDRDIDEAALDVHGLTTDFLKDKPRFSEVVGEFMEFIDGSELVIHNAAFDIAFIDYEFGRLPDTPDTITAMCRVTDTLALARHKHPGMKNSLDALCKRYEVDNSKRELHGALFDARLLAEVYLAMTGGQAALLLEGDEEDSVLVGAEAIRRVERAGLSLVVRRANAKERDAHETYLATIDRASSGRCVWKHLVEAADEPEDVPGLALAT